MNKKSKIFRFLLYFQFLFLFTKISAQNKLALSQALEQLEQSNLELKTFEKLREQNTALMKSQSIFDGTQLNYQYGQFNDFYNDHGFSIQQSFQSPFLIHSEKNYFKIKSEQIDISNSQMKAQLAAQVKLLFGEYSFAENARILIEKQQKLLEKLQKSIESRVKSGETNPIQQLTVQNKIAALNKKLIDLKLLKETILAELQTILNQKSILAIDTLRYFPNLPQTPNFQSVNSDSSIYLKNAQKSLELKQQLIEIEQKKRSPSFGVSYNYMSFNQVFGGSYLGLSLNLPLFFTGQKQKINAAKSQYELQDIENSQLKNKLNNQIEVLQKQLILLNNQVENYREKYLSASEKAIEKEELRMKSGAINYVEFYQNVETAWETKMQYLTLMRTFYQYLFQLELLNYSKI